MKIGNTLGSLLAGSLIAAVFVIPIPILLFLITNIGPRLYGITLIQTYIFFARKSKDTVRFKAMVRPSPFSGIDIFNICDDASGKMCRLGSYGARLILDVS